MKYKKLTQDEFSKIYGTFAAAGGEDIRGVSADDERRHTYTGPLGESLNLTAAVMMSLAKEAGLC
jgi:hypothetical protein